jgi:large subunit ribosomal protein L23
MSKEKQIALHLYDVIKRPLVTEKSQMGLQSNQYTFEVLPAATYAVIKTAVETMFSVSVESVNTMNKFGKNKVFKGRKGQRQDTKKAIVRLKSGDSIAVGLGA